MSRRERLRAETRDEIKALARQQMAEGGTASLSLNGIARAMELVPSALYRYYPSRDDLITALVVDAFHALADALTAADAQHEIGDYPARLLAAALAYRNWGLERSVDFLLIFGNPIPGYQAPPDTMLASGRTFGVFLCIMQGAYSAGKLLPPPEHRQPGASITMAMPNPRGGLLTIEPVVHYSGMACWTAMHGIVMLELTGSLRHSIADPDTFYHNEMLAIQRRVGMR
jgi:AcrR family transcriptional regulator